MRYGRRIRPLACGTSCAEWPEPVIVAWIWAGSIRVFTAIGARERAGISTRCVGGVALGHSVTDFFIRGVAGWMV